MEPDSPPSSKATARLLHLPVRASSAAGANRPAQSPSAASAALRGRRARRAKRPAHEAVPSLEAGSLLLNCFGRCRGSSPRCAAGLRCGAARRVPPAGTNARPGLPAGGPAGPRTGRVGRRRRTRPHLSRSAATRAGGRDPLSAPEQDVNNPRPPQRTGRAAPGWRSRAGARAGRGPRGTRLRPGGCGTCQSRFGVLTAHILSGRGRGGAPLDEKRVGEAALHCSTDAEVGPSPVRRPRRNLRNLCAT